MEVVRFILLGILGLLLIGLWALTINAVYDRILDIHIRAKEEQDLTPYELQLRSRPVNPLLVKLVNSRIAVALALILAPLLVIGWYLWIIAVFIFFLLPVEAFEGLRDIELPTKKRAQRH